MLPINNHSNSYHLLINSHVSGTMCISFTNTTIPRRRVIMFILQMELERLRQIRCHDQDPGVPAGQGRPWFRSLSVTQAWAICPYSAGLLWGPLWGTVLGMQTERTTSTVQSKDRTLLPHTSEVSHIWAPGSADVSRLGQWQTQRPGREAARAEDLIYLEWWEESQMWTLWASKIFSGSLWK